MQVFSNNASTKLSVSLTATATSMTVYDSSRFKSLAVNEYEIITLTDGVYFEIVKVKSRSGTTWSIERGKEGSSSRLWSINTKVEGRITAGTLANFVSNDTMSVSLTTFMSSPSSSAILSTAITNYFTINKINTSVIDGISAGGSDQLFLNKRGTWTAPSNIVTTNLKITGSTKESGVFYSGTVIPSSVTRLNYDGFLYATKFVGDGSLLSNLSVNAFGTIPAANKGTYFLSAEGTWVPWTNFPVSWNDLENVVLMAMPDGGSWSISETPGARGVTINSKIATVAFGMSKNKNPGFFYSNIADLPTSTNKVLFDGFMYATKFIGDGSLITNLTMPDISTLPGTLSIDRITEIDSTKDHVFIKGSGAIEKVNLTDDTLGTLATTRLTGVDTTRTTNFLRVDGVWEKINLSTDTSGILGLDKIEGCDGSSVTNFLRQDGSWSLVSLENCDGILDTIKIDGVVGTTNNKYLKDDGSWQLVDLDHGVSGSLATSKIAGYDPDLHTSNRFLRNDGTWSFPDLSKDTTGDLILARLYGHSATETTKFLRNDGSWSTVALDTAAGVLDTSKLEGIGTSSDTFLKNDGSWSQVSLQYNIKDKLSTSKIDGYDISKIKFFLAQDGLWKDIYTQPTYTVSFDKLVISEIQPKAGDSEVTFTENIVVDGNLYVAGLSTINGNVYCGGDTSVSGTFTVTGESLVTLANKFYRSTLGSTNGYSGILDEVTLFGSTVTAYPTMNYGGVFRCSSLATRKVRSEKVETQTTVTTNLTVGASSGANIVLTGDQPLYNATKALSNPDSGYICSDGKMVLGSPTSVNLSVGIGTAETNYFASRYSFSTTKVDSTLGTNTNPWNTVYIATAPIVTSDARYKIINPNKEVPGITFISKLRPVSYKLKSFIDDDYLSGNTIQEHWGLIAQEVKQAMDDMSIPPIEFGGWVQEEHVDSKQMLRYEEFIAPIIKAIQDNKFMIDKNTFDINHLNTVVVPDIYDKIDILNTNVEDIFVTINDIQDRIAVLPSLLARTDVLEEIAIAVSDAIDDLNDGVEDLTILANDTSEKMATMLTTTIPTITTNVLANTTAVTGPISASMALIPGLRTDIDNTATFLSTKIPAIESDISAIETQITNTITPAINLIPGLRSDINALQTLTNSHTVSISSLQASDSTQSSSISSLQTTVAGHTTSIANIWGASVYGSITDIYSKLP